LINGTYGEFSATARLASPSFSQQLRQFARSLLQRGSRQTDMVSANDAFHVRLAPHRLARLPDFIKEAIALPGVAVDHDPELFGYWPGASKALQHPNEFYPGALRMEFPYRDVRLLRLFASFPFDMLRRSGADRGVARQMLKGRLPDRVRLRQSGMPAWPDQLARLQRQALSARERISVFRKAEVQDWLDLDWLESALGRVSAHGVRDIADANEVQVTAIMAEFLTWWRMSH
jgi:asparagine synthase (glutamine-hydrolysing)